MPVDRRLRLNKTKGGQPCCLPFVGISKYNDQVSGDGESSSDKMLCRAISKLMDHRIVFCLEFRDLKTR